MFNVKKLVYMALLITILISTSWTGVVSAAPSAVQGISGVQAPLYSCRNSVRLTPGEIPGWPWQQHRHYLQINFQYGGKYVIANQTYYTLYSWDRWGYYGNTTRFGVPTGYVATHPGWKNEYWLLLYNCD
jgi:hypothetical protein